MTGPNPNQANFDRPMLRCSELFEIIPSIQKGGTPILLVEQNEVQALEIATRAYVMQIGRIVLEGTGQQLLDDPDVQKHYLGENAVEAEQRA